MSTYTILLTCEHAVNTIPAAFQAAFQSYASLLSTHQGYDIAAQQMAKRLSSTEQLPYFEAKTSRLLIDYNRSLHHPRCFSAISQSFDAQTKQHIIQDYYLPYRTRILSFIENALQHQQRILHLSIHSFTPQLNGVIRQADIGLLYDSRRNTEQTLAKQWQQWLVNHSALPLIIRRNYPYLGKSDGFTTFCRQQFSEESYIGFELEFNQAALACHTKQQALETLMCHWISKLQSLCTAGHLLK